MDTKFLEKRGVDMDMAMKKSVNRGVDMDMVMKNSVKRGVDMDMVTLNLRNVAWTWTWRDTCSLKRQVEKWEVGKF